MGSDIIVGTGIFAIMTRLGGFFYVACQYIPAV